MMTPEAPMPPLVGRWATVAGLRVFTRVAEPAGTPHAPPIVYIQGLGMSGRYLEPVAARLLLRHAAHVPDLPGYGYSDKPRRPLNIPELGEALAGYLDAVGAPRAVVLGHSTGALVAAEFAYRYPERTESAILVSPAGDRHNRPLPRGLVQLARDFRHEPLGLARLAIPDYFRFGPLNYVRAFQRMTRYPTVERLSQIRVPFLTLIGTRDPLVSESQMERILRSSTAMDLARHRDAAHAIHFSHTESLARIVDVYLRGEPLHELVEDDWIIAHVENGQRNQDA
jgi:pimeloyl-ACP methyl ester carboxylesterase